MSSERDNSQLTPNPLQLFQNHEELLTGLAKTLTKVSDVLPQIEIQLDLYDEPLMQLAAEMIYTHFIELFHEMVKFYEESPLKHAWKSFSAPWAFDLLQSSTRSTSSRISCGTLRLRWRRRSRG